MSDLEKELFKDENKENIDGEDIETSEKEIDETEDNNEVNNGEDSEDQEKNNDTEDEEDNNINKEENDITEDMENDSYKNILGKIADAVWAKNGESNYVNKATNRFEALVEIANGLRGEVPDYEDEEVLKKQPRTISQALVSILNALTDVEDDFSEENAEYVNKEIFSDPVEEVQLVEVLAEVSEKDEVRGKTVEDFGVVKIFADGTVLGSLNFVQADEIEESEDETVTEESEIVPNSGYYLTIKFEAIEDITKLEVTTANGIVEVEDTYAIYLGVDKHVAKKQRILLTGKNDENEVVAQLVIKPYNVVYLPYTNISKN